MFRFQRPRKYLGGGTWIRRVEREISILSFSTCFAYASPTSPYYMVRRRRDEGWDDSGSGGFLSSLRMPLAYFSSSTRSGPQRDNEEEVMMVVGGPATAAEMMMKIMRRRRNRMQEEEEKKRKEQYCTCPGGIYSPRFALEALAEEPSIPPYSRWYFGGGGAAAGGGGCSRRCCPPSPHSTRAKRGNHAGRASQGNLPSAAAASNSSSERCTTSTTTSTIEAEAALSSTMYESRGHDFPQKKSESISSVEEEGREENNSNTNHKPRVSSTLHLSSGQTNETKNRTNNSSTTRASSTSGAHSSPTCTRASMKKEDHPQEDAGVGDGAAAAAHSTRHRRPQFPFLLSPTLFYRHYRMQMNEASHQHHDHHRPLSGTTFSSFSSSPTSRSYYRHHHRGGRGRGGGTRMLPLLSLRPTSGIRHGGRRCATMRDRCPSLSQRSTFRYSFSTNPHAHSQHHDEKGKEGERDGDGDNAATYYCQCCFKPLAMPEKSVYTSWLYQSPSSPPFLGSPFSSFSSSSHALSWSAKASTAVSSVVDILRASTSTFFSSSSSSVPMKRNPPHHRVNTNTKLTGHTFITSNGTVMRTTPSVGEGTSNDEVKKEGKGGNKQQQHHELERAGLSQNLLGGFPTFYSSPSYTSRTSERLRVLLSRIGPLLRLLALHKSSSKKSVSPPSSSSTLSLTPPHKRREEEEVVDQHRPHSHHHFSGIKERGGGGRLKALLSVGLEIGAQIHRATSSTSRSQNSSSSSSSHDHHRRVPTATTTPSFSVASTSSSSPSSAFGAAHRWGGGGTGIGKSSSLRRGTSEHQCAPPGAGARQAQTSLSPTVRKGMVWKSKIDAWTPSPIRPSRSVPLLLSNFLACGTPTAGRSRRRRTRTALDSTEELSITAASSTSPLPSTVLSVGVLASTLAQRYSLFSIASEAVRYAVAVYGRAYEEGFLHSLRSGVLLFAHPTYQALHYLPTSVQVSSLARLLHLTMPHEGELAEPGRKQALPSTTPPPPLSSISTSAPPPPPARASSTTGESSKRVGADFATWTARKSSTTHARIRRGVLEEKNDHNVEDNIEADQGEAVLVTAHYHTDDVLIGSTYAVCIDHRRRRFIVTFRGTSTLSDALCAVKDGYATITVTLPDSAVTSPPLIGSSSASSFHSSSFSIFSEAVAVGSEDHSYRPRIPTTKVKADEKERKKTTTAGQEGVHRIHTRVPLGFFQLTLTHASRIIEILQTLAAAHPFYEVLLTGHSLGGIQASLFHILCCLPYPTVGRDPTWSRGMESTDSRKGERSKITRCGLDSTYLHRRGSNNTTTSSQKERKMEKNTKEGEKDEKSAEVMLDKATSNEEEMKEVDMMTLPHLFTKCPSSSSVRHASSLSSASSVCSTHRTLNAISDDPRNGKNNHNTSSSTSVNIAGIRSVCFAPAPFVEKDAALAIGQWLTTVEGKGGKRGKSDSNRTSRINSSRKMMVRGDVVENEREGFVSAPPVAAVSAEIGVASPSPSPASSFVGFPSPCVFHQMLSFCYGEDIVPRLQIRALRSFILDEEADTEELYEEGDDTAAAVEEKGRRKSSSSYPWYATLWGANPFAGLREAAARRLAWYPPPPASLCSSCGCPPLRDVQTTTTPTCARTNPLPLFYIPGVLFFLSCTSESCGGLAPSTDLEDPERRRLHLLLHPGTSSSSSTEGGGSHVAAGRGDGGHASRHTRHSKKSTGGGKSDSTMDLLRHHLPKYYVHRIIAEQAYYEERVRERAGRCAVSF